MDPELRRRLHSVDPDLKIISIPHRSHKREKPVDSKDWEKVTGDPCPKCGAPEVRFINGVCRHCHTQKKDKLVKQEASLNPLIHECKDKRLASRVQRYLAKLDRKA